MTDSDQSPHSPNSTSNHKINGFVIGYLIGLILLWNGCASFFKDNQGYHWAVFIPFLIIFGSIFAFIGAFIGKQIKADDNSANVLEVVQSYIKSNTRKTLLIGGGLFLLFLSWNILNKKKELPCLSDLKNTENCSQWLQGNFHWRYGPTNTGEDWYVYIHNDFIRISKKKTGEPLEILVEDHFYIDDFIDYDGSNDLEYRQLLLKRNPEQNVFDRVYSLCIGVSNSEKCGVLCFRYNPIEGVSPVYFKRIED